MVAKQEPSLGLNYGWALGEDGWNTGMDDNLVKLGCVVQLVALGVVNTPAVTTNGTVYLVGTSPTGDFAGQANKVAFRVEGAWVFYAPLSGWIAMVGGVPFRYNGTAWATQKATSQQAIDGTDDILFITPAALKSALNAVGAGSTGLTNATNLNNVVTNTPFAWTTTATNTPVASSSGRGVTIATSATDATQYAFINATGDLRVRFLTSGTWGAWIAVSVAATSEVAIAGTDNTYKITPAALKAVLDAKGLGTSLTASTNLNNETGNAPFAWSATTTNIPVASSVGRGFTIASDANNLTQFAWINTTGQMWVRFRTTGTWGAWQLGVPMATSAEAKAATRADVPATPAGVREFMEQYGFTSSYTTDATDLNALTGSTDRTVFFGFNASTLNIPFSGAYGRGIMFAGGGNYSTQVVWINGSSDQYVRFHNGTTWSAWTKQAFNENDMITTPWISASLQNGWTGTAIYRKTLGRIWLVLALSGGTFSDGTLLFTLPVGTRPTAACFFWQAGNSASSTSPTYISVDPTTGEVKLRNAGQAIVRSTVSFDIY